MGPRAAPPTRRLASDAAYAQEEYIKDEIKNLKRELVRAKEVGVRPRQAPPRGQPAARLTASPPPRRR